MPPRRQEEMIDTVKVNGQHSVRKCCRVLGFRRATYLSRKSGNRPEVADQELADLLRRAAAIASIKWN